MEPTNRIHVNVNLALLRHFLASLPIHLSGVSDVGDDILNDYLYICEIFQVFIIFSFLIICQLTSTSKSHLI